jgi:hypothetical protein
MPPEAHSHRAPCGAVLRYSGVFRVANDSRQRRAVHGDHQRAAKKEKPMVTMVEYPTPPDPTPIILTIIVEIIKTLIAKRVITKPDARRLLAEAAKSLSADKKTAGPRNARFVRSLAKMNFG